MRIRVCAAAAAATVLVLAGCASPGPQVADPGEAAAETAAVSSPAEGAYAFGQEATWPDGVKVRVSKPTVFKPGEYAAISDKSVKNFVAVDITLTNGSSAAVEASNIVVRATSGDREAEAVFDGDRSTFPSSRVMPGKSLKWRQAFGKPGSDFLLTVDWGYSGQPVTFQ